MNKVSRHFHWINRLNDLINTQLELGGFLLGFHKPLQRFSSWRRGGEGRVELKTAKAVEALHQATSTQLKLGVNEKDSNQTVEEA
jgi:hypothetical protein